MNPLDSSVYEHAMSLAINAAEQFLGATAPNPPVGAIALDKNGKVLLGAGHPKAGDAHAEAKLLDLAAQIGLLEKIHTIVVTLEPCNHHGQTGPCTEAILQHKNIRRVVIGTTDPNPKVKGGGAKYLESKGIEVIQGVLKEECDFLIRAFAKHIRTGLPWITVKTALTPDGSMIPPLGHKTFTSESSLRLAHELRKRVDAIWTGSGTILADNPAFTVRHVKDHNGKKRFLVISDRRGQVKDAYRKDAESRGFALLCPATIAAGLETLGKLGVLEVLVEAGPKLQQAFLESGLWDEHVVIRTQENEEDEVSIEFKE